MEQKLKYVSRGRYFVPSDNFKKNRIEYLTVMDGERQYCTCNDYKFHREQNGEMCKHMRQVILEMVKKEAQWK